MKQKLTEEHIRKLKRIMRDPISCFNESDEELIAQELPKTLEERNRLSDEISKQISFQIFNPTEEVIFNYGTIGNKLLNQDKIQEAMAAYKLAIEYGKGNKFFTDNYYPIPYLGLGLIFENEQPKKALAFFNKAINMANNFYIDTENIYYEEEINNYNDALAKAYLYKAFLLEKLKQFDEAAINYGESTIYNKYMYSAYFGKAACLGKLGKTEEAITMYDKLLTLNPHHSKNEHCIYAYYNKAHLFKSLQKYEEEINHFHLRDESLFYSD